MNGPRRRRRARPPIAVALVAALVTACATPSNDALTALDELPDPPPFPTTSVPGRIVGGACDATASYGPTVPLPPSGPLPPRAEEIADPVEGDRVVRVGVDEHTLGFAFRRSPGDPLEGFEIDLAKALLTRIYGPAVEVDFVPLNTKQKIDLVEDGTVDMTISAVTMSCDRWERVGFSAEYFTARQQFLVRDDFLPIRLEDLDGRTVCVTAGSSSGSILRWEVPQIYWEGPRLDGQIAIELLQVPTRADCLVALQQGEADAYFSHDSFLYGMVLEDPTMHIVTDLLLDDVVTSHYGVAIACPPPRPRPTDCATEDQEFIRLVNAALEDLREDGTMAEFYDQLEEDLNLESETLPDPPEPRYRD